MRNEKADRFIFIRYQCGTCGASLVETVPVRNKSVRCMSCGARIPLKGCERSDSPFGFEEKGT